MAYLLCNEPVITPKIVFMKYELTGHKTQTFFFFQSHMMCCTTDYFACLRSKQYS